MLTRARAAVLGSPIAHSLSPLLHRAAYEETGLAQWSYAAHEVGREHLAEFVAGLGPQWRGLSLTMPLKEDALLVAAHASPLALQMGAANTLLRATDGSWRAENTDVEGVRAALASAWGAGAQPRSASVIGSGATARSVLAALHQLRVQQVRFVVRDQVRESTLAQARDHGLTVLEAGDLSSWADADVLVSTTPAGAADALASAIWAGVGEGSLAAQAPAGQVVLDVVYAGWPTALAQACGARGAEVVGGIEMLIHQAAAQFTLMTGQPAPLERMQQVGRAAVTG